MPAEHREVPGFDCPHCGEPNGIDADSITSGEYVIQDCWVCCRPIGIVLEEDEDGHPILARVEAAS